MELRNATRLGPSLCVLVIEVVLFEGLINVLLGHPRRVDYQGCPHFEVLLYTCTNFSIRMQGNENVSASTQVSYDDPLLCTTELPTMITSPAVEKLQAAKKVNKKSKKGGKRGGGKRRKRSDQNETKNETAQEKTG